MLFDLDSAILLATALVSSRLDYCNSLLYGIADIDLTKASACTESTDPPGDKVSSIYSQYSTASFSSVVAIDTVTPHGLLMLRNCFPDFAVEH